MQVSQVTCHGDTKIDDLLEADPVSCAIPTATSGNHYIMLIFDQVAICFPAPDQKAIRMVIADRGNSTYYWHAGGSTVRLRY